MDPLADAYDRHGPALYRFLRAYLANPHDAADALQTIFVKLASRGVEGIRDMQAYLWTAARNEARRIGVRRREPWLEPRDGYAPPSGERDSVEASLASLPDEQREVVILHALEGLTFREVGERLEISPDTAASRFRYAREKLKDIL